MSGFRITIDTGTTNTRAILWKDGKFVEEQKTDVGVRCTAADGSPSRLKQAVKDCIHTLMAHHSANFDDIECILASGMITSNVGLAEIPHLTAPAGLKELSNGMCTQVLADICPLPIWFVPGIKNNIDSICEDTFEQLDMMRGEEVESIALLEELPKGVPYLFVLPGSHTKFVSTDTAGRITGCLTTLAGELLSVLTLNTVLADAVGRQFANMQSYDREMVLLGFRTAKSVGITRAAFSARILNQFVQPDKAQIVCYLLGAVFQGDAAALKNTTAIRVSKETHIIVSGKDVLQAALYDVLREDGGFANLNVYQNQDIRSLSAKGMLAVYDRRMNC